MSNNYQLVCLSHEGGEQYSDEVGNNDAKPASIVMENRENIAKMAEMLGPLELRIKDVAHAHWDNYMINAIMFVADHPTCEIELHDEYGALIPFEGQPDPHDGPDKFCSKCGGRLGPVGTPVGDGVLVWQENVCVAQTRDREKIACLHWFKEGYKHPEPKNDEEAARVRKLNKLPGFHAGRTFAILAHIPDDELEARAIEFYEMWKAEKNKE